MAEYRHGRIYVEREDPDRLYKQVWAFDEHPKKFLHHIGCPVRLLSYVCMTRPTTRHKYRGDADRFWVARPEQGQRVMDSADVPEFEDVIAEMLECARAHVGYLSVAHSANT